MGVREKLAVMATNFKCEDVLAADVCEKIKDLAAVLKVKAAIVDKAIRDLVAKGITKAKEILKKLKEHFFPALSDEEFMEIALPKKCEDILSEKACAKLRETAEKLKLEAKEIDALVRKVVAEKVTEAKAIIKEVREKLAVMATNFKCEDVLAA